MRALYPHTCACGSVRLLPRYRLETTKQCKACQARGAARQHRLDNPSGPERAMIRILDSLKITYEREVPCGPYFIDFVIGSKAIEINGGKIHTVFREPGKEEARFTYIRDRFELLLITSGNVKYSKILVKDFLYGT